MSDSAQGKTQGEGVIQFDLDFLETAGRDWIERFPPLLTLDGWRAVLRRLGLLGQDPQRYDGYGFGNLSHRVPAALGDASGFLVSGSQTGGRELLGSDGWALVRSFDLDTFRVEAEGPVPPSSESLTHAVIYDKDPDVHSVVHVHSPELWHAAERLDFPRTGPHVDYGSPEMVRAVRELFELGVGDLGIFAMAGHEDGIVAFGADADDACGRLLGYLARALVPV